MSCLLTGGYTLDNCAPFLAGIQEVYIGQWNSNNTTYTYGTNSVITGFNFVGGTVSFHTFQQDVNKASYNEPAEAGENGNSPINQSLEITLNKMTPELRNIIQILLNGRWRIIFLTKDGDYRIMGEVSPVRVTTSAIGHGKTATDLNGATLTFTTTEKELARYVETAAALSVIV